MSDEGFLKRWSRRKREPGPDGERTAAESPPSHLPPQAGQGAEIVPPPRSGAGQAGASPQASSPNAKHEDEAVDPETLPPIESLGPDSDYTVFLKKGVPEALRIAALRKAWMSDPFIRDFRGPAEYAIDYTTPEFDLRPTDNVAKMLDRIFPPQTAAGETPPEPPSAPAAPAPQGPQPSRSAT
ncbi:MAG: DUF3306 domain-containing protein, partial [Planctomycetes bacterium]|nr:DUF3306 domain-containing protein [Planctomycetota bacterium]